MRNLVVGQVGIRRITKPLRTNGGGVVPRDDKRSARDGRQWPRRDLLEVSRSMSLDRGSKAKPAHQQRFTTETTTAALATPPIVGRSSHFFRMGLACEKAQEKPKLSLINQRQQRIRVSPILHGIQMTMWGEVAELMEDLLQHICYCPPSLKAWKLLLGQTRMLLTLNVLTKAYQQKISFHLVGSSTASSTP